MLDIAPIIIALAAHHGYRGASHEARLTAVAADIAEVSSHHPIYCGDAGADATALALVAIADHESGWHPGVQDGSLCQPGSKWCDRGRSISLYQLRVGVAWGGHTRTEIDGSNALATRLALRVLSRFAARSVLTEQFCGYASGGFARCKAGDQIAQVYATLLARTHVVLHYSNGCMRANYVTSSSA